MMEIQRKNLYLKGKQRYFYYIIHMAVLIQKNYDIIYLVLEITKK